MMPTVARSLYSREATVDDKAPYLLLIAISKGLQQVNLHSQMQKAGKEAVIKEIIRMKKPTQSNNIGRFNLYKKLTMTRGGLADPLEAFFSFKRAALFCSRSCKTK